MNGVVVKPAPRWWRKTGEWIRSGLVARPGSLRIGLALGGGFARGIAHIGVLRVLERNNIPISAIAGVSSGAIVAAAACSGATADDIEKIALSMKFRDVARWTLNLQGLAGSDRMISFLSRLLKATRFEDMKTPLAIVATDLVRGKSVTFHGKGDVVFPIRASCAYPGLFLPLRHQDRLLVDGFVSMEVPAAVLPQLGANYVISVAIPNNDGIEDYGNMFSVVSRCFQVMSARNEHAWRRFSNVVIAPPVANMTWDSFASAKRLIDLGEKAARAALPQILAVVRARGPAPERDAETVPVTA
ncbi:MAG TPA: patatin-like phospholipase family protein [Bryobacteraceae bacterium]|nr:patatin-like phospholipase family protein [Bryobacteraceae bacterium]